MYRTIYTLINKENYKQIFQENITKEKAWQIDYKLGFAIPITIDFLKFIRKPFQCETTYLISLSNKLNNLGVIKI